MSEIVENIKMDLGMMRERMSKMGQNRNQETKEADWYQETFGASRGQ